MSKKLLASLKDKYLNKALATATDEEKAAWEEFKSVSTRDELLAYLGVTDEDVKAGKYE
jgi:hypothetical protein